AKQKQPNRPAPQIGGKREREEREKIWMGVLSKSLRTTVVVRSVARGRALSLPIRVSVMRTSLGELCTSTTLTVTELRHAVSLTARLDRANSCGVLPTLPTLSPGLSDLVITPAVAQPIPHHHHRQPHGRRRRHHLCERHNQARSSLLALLS